MPLSIEKHELLARVRDAIYTSGWRMIFENAEHPCLIRTFRNGKPIRMLVYIWRLTRGGPPGIRPAGEFRIQLTGVDPPLRTGNGYVTLLLGWHDSLGVFAGFDVTRRPQTWGKSPSVQIREDALANAAKVGFGFHRRATKEGEIAVAFAPDSFMDYVQRQAEFHEFGAYPAEVKVLDEVASEEFAVETEASVDLDKIGSSGRKQVVRTVKERIGQANFRARVLFAYRHHCAMCGLQLELVEAAHIVPVRATGDNLTSNGLALCYLHHEAYDRSLVAADGDYRVIRNEQALRRLRRIGRNAREGEFIASLRAEIFLPGRQQDYPSPDRLREGLRVRGWPTAAA